MPSLDFLLRCLLLVTLCLDGRVLSWPSNANAGEPANATVTALAQAPAASRGDDCAESGKGGRGGAHDDCDCAKGTCGCICFLSVAALPAVAPSLLPHALLAEPLVWSAPHVPSSTRTPLFRPPIV
ncbi:CopL family metal-binding regulatory protein [Tahibacter soli]|uniref:CopL family metal-binding regulatory protein n=1 Tax=Tahibacter soli TaxID=2983605 RepID=A0A9X3YHH3_9GAMM|nr:CopL family metal-binding regulatory protein [Tahibacter soli]MDC8011180.1 CopL family metal-binding regulatory protein [Tahibacter soli]